MFPVVFGTAWLMVTMLLGLVSSWRSLLPSTKKERRGRGEGLHSELGGVSSSKHWSRRSEPGSFQQLS